MNAVRVSRDRRAVEVAVPRLADSPSVPALGIVSTLRQPGVPAAHRTTTVLDPRCRPEPAFGVIPAGVSRLSEPWAHSLPTTRPQTIPGRLVGRLCAFEGARYRRPCGERTSGQPALRGPGAGPAVLRVRDLAASQQDRPGDR